MSSTYYKDNKTSDVYAYDDDQMSVIDRINSPDFDNESENVSDIFFEINEKIKSMHKMSAKEIDAHINPPVTKDQLTAEAESKKQVLISEATAAIAPLQDAIDLDIATPEETSALKEWKTYRVMLNRVDTSLGADVIWPMPPA